jgi:hypothetical protein
LVLLAVASAAGVAALYALRVVEAGDFSHTELAEGGSLHLRRLEGPSGTAEAELQRHDAAGRVLWRAPIENVTEPHLVVVGRRVLTRVTRPPFEHAWLHAYDLETGVRQWAQPCDDLGSWIPDPLQLVTIDEGRVLEVVHLGGGSRLRLRELEQGTLIWDVGGPWLEEWTRLRVRRHRDALFLERTDGVSSARLDVATGSLDFSAPSEAISVCRTSDDEVVYLGPGRTLTWRARGGAPVTLGRLRATGRVRCARDGADLFITWSDEDPTGESSPTVPALSVLDRIDASETTTGVLALIREGAVRWAIHSGWGFVDVGIDAPTDDDPGVPTREGDVLVGRVVEAPRFVGEEVGDEGGRSAPIRIDAATGRALR